ncbi:18.0 kDa class I heat shock protein-like [Iris pallida]|uniref:18.0 kDa class I heat shock protein-like n=1 Tax=Iris pallida TaxID=29817 RepID=A0AAX6G0Y7_IRIPA|nr:18.0 kDa class I heat shock protein-like [Iris pallida]
MSIIPSFFGHIAASLPTSGLATTRMDWKETPDAHVFIAEVPGMKKEDLKIEVEVDKILKISGQRAKEGENKDEKWHWIERSYDKFQRSVKLPPNARVGEMKAAIESGVLTVTVPKGQEDVQGGRLIQIAG